MKTPNCSDYLCEKKLFAAFFFELLWALKVLNFCGSLVHCCEGRRMGRGGGHCLLQEIHYSGRFVVVYFQASERCHGMILSSYMLKPVQRIPSYRLLLIGEYKHLVCKS